ncbi:MAG: FIST C-terminal domain-containing protein [Treponema sp.]|nr:FIST C-terminal domain-containing protein [Treponema sp.]
MERSLIAFSGTGVKEDDYTNCFQKISSQNSSPKIIIFFSDYQDLWYYAKQLKEDFPEATSIGCSTCMNFSTEGYSEKGLSAMAIYNNVECSSGLLYEVSRHPKNYCRHINEALKSLNSTDNTICLEFTTSGSRCEELVLDTFEEILLGTDIKVAGSTAGSNKNIRTSAVALNGDIYIESCAFIFIHNLSGKIHLYRENLFRPTSHVLLTTDVDCENLRVYEYDNKPAAKVLCELLHVDRENLLETLKLNPIGRIEGNNILISEAAQIMDDDSIVYYSRLYNQTRVVLLEQDNYDSVWDETQNAIKKMTDKPSFSIAVHCYSRKVMLEEQSRFDDFSKRLITTLGKYIGVCGFGEQIMFNNLNQSLVLIIFE